MAFQPHIVMATSLYAVPSFAPFPLSKNVLALMGGGAVFEDNPSANVPDMRIRCKFLYRSAQTSGTTGAGLGGRMQPDGSMYVASFTFDTFSSGLKGIILYRYDGPSHTFNFLGESGLSIASTYWDIPLNTIFGLNLIVKGNSFFASIHENDTRGEILDCIGVNDNGIAGLGRPAILGGFLKPNQNSNYVHIDNYEVEAL